ncbi:MAG TPA: hypothetical protein VGM19_00885 [Armatimonadota bacterium]|jgi:hypothetical protein
MDWESRLRETALPAPPEEPRRALLREAARRQAQRRRVTARRWATVGLAALLLALNLVVGGRQDRRLAALIGPLPPVSSAQLAEDWREQQQFLAEILGDTPTVQGGERHDYGPLSDFASSGPRPA